MLKHLEIFLKFFEIKISNVGNTSCSMSVKTKNSTRRKVFFIQQASSMIKSPFFKIISKWYGTRNSTFSRNWWKKYRSKDANVKHTLDWMHRVISRFNSCYYHFELFRLCLFFYINAWITLRLENERNWILTPIMANQPL